MQIQNTTLVLLDNQQQLTIIDLADIQQPAITARYQTLNPANQITTNNETLYLSGNTSITALRPLPGTTLNKPENNMPGYNLNIAADMPIGNYHLHIDDQRINNGVAIELPKFNKPKFSMDDLNKALEKMRQQQAAP
jgi:hypothetical protein